MKLQGLSRILAHDPSYSTALTYADQSADFSVAEGMRLALLGGLIERRRAAGKPPAVLVVTATGRESESVQQALPSFAPDAEIVAFPAWETLPHERLSPSSEIVGRRIDALWRMAEWTGEKPLVIVASVRAALQPVAHDLTDIEPIRLHAGSRGHELGDIVTRLVELAYSRVDLVSRRGEFAVRGGILDVFPTTADHPVRVEFFGDEVDQIKPFSVSDQRSSTEEYSEVSLLPSRELLLTPNVRQRAAEMLPEFPSLSTMLEKVAVGIPVEGMESLAPALLDRLVSIAHYLPEGTGVAVLSPERVVARSISLSETNREFLEAAWSAATAGAEAPIDLGAGEFISLNTLRDDVTLTRPGEQKAESPWWTFSPFQQRPDDLLPEELELDDLTEVRVAADPVPSFQGNVDGAIGHVDERRLAGWSIAVAAQGQGLVERALDVLTERGIPARIVEELPDAVETGVVYLVQAVIEHGFELPGISFALVGEAEFYGRSVGYDSRAVKKLATRRKNVVDPLQLKAGDHVVHQTHGIGRFVEMTRREVSTGGRNAVKTMREYLVLEYAPSKRGFPGDKLLVPTDQLDLLTRYVGGESPALSKMGGSDWSQAKSKARKAVRDIAVELVKLYAARMAAKGHAFGPDTPWQRELEDAFPFAETPDQLTTIDEVKRDMERPIPMDRLLSGDVGFGKTEVAVRAAFKAVQEGKQVAILVPTTLLVKQHGETFQERFAGFPVHLRSLSRFQSDKDARETFEGLAQGSVDVVIGTHRLLTEKVSFKNLGLVIVDEEQRFGVEHKDSLKKLKTNVDVLAMSATPIPRTLEMAVTGIREMSTLATPPEERHPILSFVGPRNDKQMSAAIRRELLREGQVFFVHNRVASINRVATELAELVPEARIAIAHGKLSESILEQVVVDFWERKFDVLVCTTIIETGLDIQNANTIIIDKADKYGLSQLHQLRGRVGRGRERAYAYFLYDGEKPLSETAQDRLETIAANNELGSGMQVALKDLEIRGAGNLLGGEQAGHIAGVGFDLYLRMIGEAVSTFRGDVAEGQTELRLEIPVDANIPEEYIDSERLRLEAYQKLSAAAAPAAADDQIDLVIDELVDRYGPLPERVQSLVAVTRLRQRAQRSNLSEVITMGTNLRLAPVDLPDSIQVRLKRMYPKARMLSQANALVVPIPQPNGEAMADTDLITWVQQLLDAILPVKPKETEQTPVS
ncbi:transcription-repair coupling factor [Paramicrobacterium chengjingii]|uniref:Transcription-repair-coupling factor n=1 Tax=Paramicrobacterium chengjingii TaxID=2769067 RepID=A0ABX6YMI3_9MICO|nr:transcription-repair coupling factor [Microbacterium chengjingii]QPZ39510.1 transcription-repair coupling factor [Microbacterium chengjingii]